MALAGRRYLALALTTSTTSGPAWEAADRQPRVVARHGDACFVDWRRHIEGGTVLRPRMTRRWMGSWGSIAALGVVVGSGLWVAPADAMSISPDYSTSDSLNFAARAVAEALTEKVQGEAGFAGIQITNTGVELDHVGPPTTQVSEAIAASAGVAANLLTSAPGAPADGRVPVVVRLVKRTLAQMASITGQIDTDQSRLKTEGIVLSSWGPDITSNTVVVHLSNYSPANAALITARYGDAVTVDASSQNASGSAGRTNDSAPWFGGDKIDQGSGSCTSWFSASRAGSSVVPTAGHCGAGAWTNGGNSVGSVGVRQFSGNMDGELIFASSSGYVWSDPTSTQRHVTGVSSTDTVGTLLCTDGATDREVCSVRISATGQSVSYDGQTITGLVSAFQTWSQAAFSAGDSGGPVEATSGSSSTIAVGMVEARLTSDASRGWYMPARTVDSVFGLTVKTS